MSSELNSKIMSIKNTLMNLQQDNIIDIIQYGSSTTDEFNNKSDIDLYVVVKKIKYSTLIKLKEFVKKEKNVFINVIKESELPKNRILNINENLFFHHNRSAIFLLDSENFKKKINITKIKPTFKEMMQEAVKSINLQSYLIRKKLINSELDVWDVIKKCILCMKYALAFKGVFKYKKQDIINEFIKEYPQYEQISNKILELFFSSEISVEENDIIFPLLIDFIEDLDETIFNEYVKLIPRMKYVKHNKISFKMIIRNRPAILFIPGAPNSDRVERLAEFLPLDIVNVFLPGSWYSEGEFLGENFNRILEDAVRCLNYKFNAVVCSSFGSYCIRALHKFSEKLVILSPVFNVYAEKNKKSLIDMYNRINGFYKTIFNFNGTCKKFLERLNELDIYNTPEIIKNKKILFVYNPNDWSVNSNTIEETIKRLSKWNKVNVIKSDLYHGYKILSNIKIAKKVMEWIIE